MSEILILGDIHGRSFWKEPCNNWTGKIIFLGDYHDPYGEYIIEEPDKVESLTNLKELATFVENRRHTSDVICLLGNHDLVYFNGNGKCRFDYWEQKEVKELISSLNPQLYYIYEDLTLKEPHKYLFSHAGITKDWLDYNNLELKDLDSIDITNLSPLDQIPYSRSGYNKYGSCVWNDLEDFQLQTPYKDYYQIFGHSWGGRTKPLITDKYAMLDCCKPFVLDTENNELKEWKLNS